jgi:hypothetical protein
MMERVSADLPGRGERKERKRHRERITVWAMGRGESWRLFTHLFECLVVLINDMLVKVRVVKRQVR